MIFHNEAGQQLCVFDRSRLDAAEHCDRLYFWAYEFMGIGIRKLKTMPEWSLLTGSYVHEGVENVLRGVDPQTAAVKAVQGYIDEVQPLLERLDLEPDRRELLQREFNQQLDLVMALVYGWAFVGLPRYQQLYELLPDGIEHEEQASFLLNSGSNGQEIELRLLTRSDILSKIRGAAGHILHNLKTVSNPDAKWQRQWAMDQQTLTERMAAEERLGSEIIGVTIEGMVKGRREEYPKGSGFWQHNSPLIWCWTDRQGQQLLGEGPGFYSRYEWSCTEPHLMGDGKRRCGGGKQHRLSGCYKARVQDVYPGGIFAWISWLNENDRELLERQFISLPPIGRSEFEIERWKRQVLPAEMRRQLAAAAVNEHFLANRKQEGFLLLDSHFPMKTAHGNCLRPSECPYMEICWGSSDPFDDSQWGPRLINHKPEMELVQIELMRMSK